MLIKLEEQNRKDDFYELIMGFLNWFFLHLFYFKY